MRKFRFFTERLNLREDSSVKLPEFEAKHIKKSLRLKKGDTIYIFNGQKEFEAKIAVVSEEAVMVKIKKEVNKLEEPLKEISIFQGLNKAKSLELTLEKTTELGINKILPFQTEYSVVKSDKVAKKIERWQKIIITACKQSERVDIPEIFPPTTFKEAVEFAKNNYDLVLFFTIPRQKIESSLSAKDLKNYKDLITNSKSIAYFIGPEGGFSPTEHEIAKQNNFKFAKLTDNVLKSETAAIAALSVMTHF